MTEFPEFMKRPVNRIADRSQATPGVEGFVFDGAHGGQIAFWTCSETAASARQVHEFDEYMVVVQGCYTLTLGRRGSPSRRARDTSSHGAGFMAAKWWPEPEPFTPLAGIAWSA
jgi:hypothetical protein